MYDVNYRETLNGVRDIEAENRLSISSQPVFIYLYLAVNTSGNITIPGMIIPSIHDGTRYILTQWALRICDREPTQGYP